MHTFERRSARAFAGINGGAPWRPGAVGAVGGALILTIAALDYATGFEIRLAILYLIPIALVTWALGVGAGITAALAAAACWLLTFKAMHPYSRTLYFYWEGGITLASFLIFVSLLGRLRASLERELTERHRDALNRTARMVALGEFASAMAHELSQPLAAIGTYNEASLRLLQQGNTDPGALREAMTKCRDQAQRAGAIIQRLREFLRHAVPALAREDLNDIAREAVRLAQADADEDGVTLRLQESASAPRVRVDRLLVEQVALNLVRNAIEAVQALPVERRSVTLAVGQGPKGDATLAVADLGEGVAPELRARLFEAFFSTKPGGLGLGLSICRSVVEAHGGTIRHELNLPYGARFVVTLPAGT